MSDLLNEPHAPTLRRLVVVALFVGVVLIALAADLWSKSAAWDYFVKDVARHEGRVVLLRTEASDVMLVPHGLELTAVANQGAAMGLGQGRQTLFLTVSVIAVFVLLAFFVHSLFRGVGGPLRQHAYQFILALLLAGVLGNFYDRLAHGYVRDMLHMLPGVHWSSIYSGWSDSELFPWVFNLADVYLCIGVGVVLLFGFIAPDDERESSLDPEQDATARAAR